MTVSLEAMYALPESWVSSAREYAYTVSLPVPINDEVILFFFYIKKYLF